MRKDDREQGLEIAWGAANDCDRELAFALKRLAQNALHAECAKNSATTCPECGPLHRAKRILGEIL